MQRPDSDMEYLLTFSSFYKAMYTRDKLLERGIPSQQRRVPAQLLRSCGQALYITGYDPESILAVLSENGIDTKGLFRIIRNRGKPEYQQLV